MATIVIGVGNPVLSDDSVGIHAVRRLANELQDRDDVVTRELYCGGLRLMEAMVGFDRAIVIDAIETDDRCPGTFYPLGVSDLTRTRNTFSTHDADLALALELGRQTGLPLPEEVRIWAVEVEDVLSFSEELTPQVAGAVPELVARVIADLGPAANTGEQAA
jgi:hydrogenase maturation protease